jgi:RNA polymerase sigma-70 factor (ECF subfamily)
MDPTSPSLLARLRQPAQQEAWARFVKLYTPFLYHWARQLKLNEQDAADLVQDVFLVLVRKLQGFTYDPQKSFRGWLRTVMLNKWRDVQRQRAVQTARKSEPFVSDLAGPDDVVAFEEAEYRQYLVSRALRLMRAEFQPATWQACWEHVVSGKPAAEVAVELGISLNSVYAAKSRVLRRLRQELQGLLD